MRFNWRVTRAHRLASFARPDRLRNSRGREQCHLEAGVLDVAAGRVLLVERDVALPGIAGLCFTREYSSAWAHRAGDLGPGWSHAFEQCVWSERDRVVARVGDGRELEFDTVTWRDRGEEFARDPLQRVTLRRLAAQRYRLEWADGSGAEFEPVAGDGPSAPSRLRAVRLATGLALGCELDRAGRVVQVRDVAGRTLVLDREGDGRLEQIVVAGAGQRSGVVWQRFQYDAQGRLARAIDARGHALEYDYAGELLVERRDRTGHSVYFGYDGRDAAARCVRTWISGGGRDRAVSYVPEKFRAVVTDSRGRSHTVAANAIGQLLEVGGVGSFQYDDEGRLVTRRDPDGRATTYELDEVGHIARVSLPDGATRSYVRDPAGHVTERTDEAGAVWTYARDAAGRLLRERDPAGLVREYEWSGGVLRAIVEGSIRRTEFGYDDALNLSRFRAANGAEARLVADPLGYPLEVVGSDGTHLALRWEAGRLVEVRDRAGRHAAFSYDAEGRLTECHDGEHVVRWRYGAAGELLERDDAGERVALTYDTEGALLEVRQGEHRVVRFARDKLGRVVEEHAGEEAVYRYKYEGASRRVRKVAMPGGLRAEYEYDVGGRVVRVKRSDAVTERYEYDRCGRLVMGARGDASLIRLRRDSAGRVVRESSSESAWVSSRWDPQGARAEVRSSLSARVVTVRDETGHPRTVVVGEVSAPLFRADFKRDGAGREVSRTLGAVRANLQRDDAGRVRTSTIATDDATLDAVHLLWDAQARATGVADRWGVHRIDRNAQGRLTRVATDGGTTVFRLSHAAGEVFRAPDTIDREYGADGALLAADGARLTYDRAGRVHRLRTAWGQVWTYEYDALGLLTRVRRPDGVRVEISYDAFGRREGLAVGENDALWVWDGDALLHELRFKRPASLWITLGEDSEPLGGVAGGRALLAAGATVEGSVRVLDGAGSMAYAALLDPYGAVQHAEGDTSWPFRWSGCYHDDETGLYYNRYRYLMPSFGRYLTRNPRGLGGLTYGYGHLNDPVHERAPRGLGPEHVGELAPRAGEPGTPPSCLLAARASDAEIARYLQWLRRTGWIDPAAPAPTALEIRDDAER